MGKEKRDRTKEIRRNIKGFFPIKLLFLHLRRSLLLVVIWILLFLATGGVILKEIGIPYLFQTPEYLDQVNALSFLIVGVVLGLFVMSFHISTYIFYSYRFPFLATQSRPLYTFSINNSIIPLAFYLFYSVIVIKSLALEGFGFFEVLFFLSSLLFGSVISLSVVFGYFFSTNKTLDIKGIPENLNKPLRELIKKDKHLENSEGSENKVRTYLKSFYKIKPAREHMHYTDKQKLETLQKHHINAALFFSFIFIVLLVLSLFVENKYFQIPAGASILLMLTIYLMIMGALYSRFKTWTISLAIILLLFINYMSGWNLFQKIHYAYGMDYSSNAKYTETKLDSITNPVFLEIDKQKTINILNNWKAKFPDGEKPKMVLINSSGGGLRSSLWSLIMYQQLDSIMNGEFLDHVFMINGSSGGMIGSAYFRELWYREKMGEIENCHSIEYFHKMGKDILNSVGFSMAVNDWFLSLSKVEVGGYKYPIDRGHLFDEKLSDNTDGFFDKSISDYQDLEFTSQMPMLVLNPTIINDGRRLLISPQGMSYMARNYSLFSPYPSNDIDGVELMRLFDDQNAGNLRFTTALRMSATFPYITPLTSLPSKPKIEVIDAGARDNDGFKLTMRFMYEFKDWISENTSGVVIIKLLANSIAEIRISDVENETRLESLAKPIKGVVSSFNNLQEFDNSESLKYADSWVDFPMEIHSLELLSANDDISLSWHLTNKEKKNILEKAQLKSMMIDLERIKDVIVPQTDN